MSVIGFRIEGDAPLLQHNPLAMHDEELIKKSNPKPEEEAPAYRYLTADDVPYHPCEAFRKALIDAGVNVKIGGRAATTTLQRTVHQLHDIAVLYPGVDAEEPHGPDDWELDVRTVVVQGNRIVRGRPKWMAWSTDVEFEFYEDEIEAEVIPEFMERAGRIEGVGDYRPSSRAGSGRGGPFGRFHVADWWTVETVAESMRRHEGF